MQNVLDKMGDILFLVKETYPQYEGETLNWIDPRDYYEESFDGDMWNICIDEWTRDRETVFDDEKYGRVIDPNIEPEVEIYFQSEEEADCYVYTDMMGNVRSLYLNID